MSRICRLCLEQKSVLETNILDYVDIIENLVEIEFDRNPELPQLICNDCEEKLSNVKATCSLCISSYEFFLNYVPKQAKKELMSENEDAEDTEYTNVEILDEDLEIKSEQDFMPLIKIESIDNEIGNRPPSPDLVKIVKKQLKASATIGHVTFCKMPKKKTKKVLTETNLVAETETKSRTKPNIPLTYYNCCKCTEVVFSNRQAELHFRENHSVDGRKTPDNSNFSEHQCLFCLKYFENEDEMNDHQSNKTTITNCPPSFVYTCTLCHQSGLSLTDYKIHGENEHGSDATYSCNLCPIIYTNFSSFTSHVYVKHKNEQNNVCSECGKSYARKSYLESHYRVDHEGRRDFQCKFCNASFKRNCNLKSHIRVHTGEKPYKCKDCPKAYSHYIDLKTHIAYQHTGIFKHNCNVCGRGFVKPSQLKIHMKKHLIATDNATIVKIEQD